MIVLIRNANVCCQGKSELEIEANVLIQFDPKYTLTKNGRFRLWVGKLNKEFYNKLEEYYEQVAIKGKTGSDMGFSKCVLVKKELDSFGDKYAIFECEYARK